MDKTIQPQQLSLSFDVPQPSLPTVASIESSLAFPKSVANVALVYDFQTAAAKREAASQAVLYRQILDSVRHIG